VRQIQITARGLDFTAVEAGAPDGRLVLCLHGFPDTTATWVHQLEALAAAGYRAVAPMLRGYEPRTAASGRRFFAGDLSADVTSWLDALGVERAHVLAHDWGAAAAYAAGAAAPERLCSLTALAVPPAGRFLTCLPRRPDQVWRSRYMVFFQLRGLSEWWLSRQQGAAIRGYWQRWSPGWSPPEAVLGAAVEALADPEVLDAALGYYRDLFAVADPRWRESLDLLTRPIRVPSLILMGERDRAIGASLLDSTVRAEDFPAGVRVVRVPRAGHWLHLQAPDAVNRQILGFLRALDA
jgi:pimeloyl-ACP methyl ester carboxylesterase